MRSLISCFGFFILSLCALGAINESPYIINGTVDRFLLAPRGEVEGVLLKDATTIRFTQQVGANLANLVHPGDTVSVTYEDSSSQSRLGRGVKGKTIENLTTGRMLPQGKNIVREKSGSTPVERSESGKILSFLFNDQGECDGVFLTTGEEVRFPSRVGNALAPLYLENKNGELSVYGLETRNDFGRVVDAHKLDFEGTELIRGSVPPPKSE